MSRTLPAWYYDTQLTKARARMAHAHESRTRLMDLICRSDEPSWFDLLEYANANAYAAELSYAQLMLIRLTADQDGNTHV
jgi:hypothetical protein